MCELVWFGENNPFKVHTPSSEALIPWSFSDPFHQAVRQVGIIRGERRKTRPATSDEQDPGGLGRAVRMVMRMTLTRGCYRLQGGCGPPQRWRRCFFAYTTRIRLRPSRSGWGQTGRLWGACTHSARFLRVGVYWREALTRRAPRRIPTAPDLRGSTTPGQPRFAQAPKSDVR